MRPDDAPLHAQSRPMNALVGELGLSSWKAIASALLLPPVPFLLLALWGALLLWSRRGVGWLLTAASLLGCGSVPARVSASC